MLRSLMGFAVLAIVGLLGVKLVFGLLGFVLSLLKSVLWLAVIGFLFYLALSVLSPRTARRIREIFRGQPDAA